MTTKQGIHLEDPLSMMIYGGISMSFWFAHAFAQLWVVHHGRNTDLDALKKA
jgi:hypothetical protein